MMLHSLLSTHVLVALLPFLLSASASPFPQGVPVTVTATTTTTQAASSTTAVTHITTWFTDQDWSGSWVTMASSEGTCITFDKTLNNAVTSFKLTTLGGPAGSLNYCYLYDAPNCPHTVSTQLNVVPNGWTYTGQDTSRLNPLWNDVVSSYRCMTKKFDANHVKPDSWILEFWFEDTF